MDIKTFRKGRKTVHGNTSKDKQNGEMDIKTLEDNRRKKFIETIRETRKIGQKDTKKKKEFLRFMEH